MKTQNWKKGLVISIIILFVGTSILPVLHGIKPAIAEHDTSSTDTLLPEKETVGNIGTTGLETLYQDTSPFQFPQKETVIEGTTGFYDVSEYDVWEIKTDQYGEEQWNRTFFGTTDDWGYTVCETADSGNIIVGWTNGTETTASDLWLIKTDDEGKGVWTKAIGGAENDGGLCVQPTMDNGYIITGVTYSYGAGEGDIWLIKTDDYGIEQWNTTFGGVEEDIGYSVQQTKDTGYIVTGHTYSYGAGGADVWLIKTDEYGNEQWNTTFGGEFDDFGFGIKISEDDGFIITGQSTSFQYDENMSCMMKGANINYPPFAPSNLEPVNNAWGVKRNVCITWDGGDPNGDLVSFDVYLGTNESNLELVASGLTSCEYEPALLEYDTGYYWQIVAWDENHANAYSQMRYFKTEGDEISVSITKPFEPGFYMMDRLLFPLRNTFIYGPITITANVTADEDVDRVEFYIDGKLKETCLEAPYDYRWAPLIQFNGLSIRHSIKVVAYDKNGNMAIDELNVSKWRFHPLLVMSGSIILIKALDLVPHTTIRGFVFNIMHTNRRMTFFALRLHYTYQSIFIFKMGVHRFKMCKVWTMGTFLERMFRPLGFFAWISCRCLGRVHTVYSDLLLFKIIQKFIEYKNTH